MNHDIDTPLMIMAAVRYALPRHSYMVGTTQDYIKRHWKSLSKYHWTILADIREYVRDGDFSNERPVEFMDVNSWIGTYNSLIENKDTNLPLPDYNYLREPLSYIE